MGLIRRILGICDTKPPADGGCFEVKGRRVEIDLARAPELAGRGGAIRLEGRGLADRILVVHGLDDEYRAFVNRCTHMGRRLDPQPGKPGVRCCSIGHSTFDDSGKPLSGMGRRDLRTLAVEPGDGRLAIRLD